MRDEFRKGGPHDDVANNIRAEQQADAAPSAEEAKAEAQRYLAEEGCHKDGCDEDNPDNLGRQAYVLHSCSARQRPPVTEPQIVCDEHARPVEERRREDFQASANEDGEIKIMFTCGILASPSEPSGHEKERYFQPVPSIDTECKCGAEIEEVFLPEVSDD